MIQSPVRLAAATALLYLLVSIIYLAVSGRFGLEHATSAESLALFEWRKGVGFMVVTAVLLFFGQLALLHNIRRLCAENRFQRQHMLRLEREALAGVFASCTAHDLNNLLTSYCATEIELDELKDELRKRGHDDLAARLAAHAQQLALSTEDMTALSRRLSEIGSRNTPGQLENLDLAELSREVFRMAEKHRSLRRCALDLDVPDTLRCRANATLIRQALLNLLLNAGEAAGEGGKVRLSLKDEGDYLRASVEDDGPGVPPQLRDRLFSPFFTTKKAGHGLGLVSAKACAEEHGGRLEVDGSILGGARFSILLAAC